jgi:hypothetical protein
MIRPVHKLECCVATHNSVAQECQGGHATVQSPGSLVNLRHAVSLSAIYLLLLLKILQLLVNALEPRLGCFV